MNKVDKSLNFRIVYKINNKYKFYYINLFQYLNNAIMPNPKWKLVSIDQYYGKTKSGENIFINDIIEFEAQRYTYWSKSKNDKNIIARGLVSRMGMSHIGVEFENVYYNQKFYKKIGKETEERYLRTWVSIIDQDKTKLIGNIYESENLLND